MRTDPGRAVADLLDDEVELLLRVRDPPDAVLFLDRFLEAATICLSIASMGPFSNERTSMSTEQEGAMVFTEVPPLIVPIVKVVTGASGTLMCAIFAPAMQTAWIADGTFPKAA